MPELEFGKAANKRSKLVGSTGGEGGAILDLGINLRREKEDEELEDVDTEAVGDDVVAMDEVHAQGVEEGDEGEADPTAQDAG